MNYAQLTAKDEQTSYDTQNITQLHFSGLNFMRAPWPRCIKLLLEFFGVFYGKNSGNSGKFFSHCNLHKDLPEFFYGQKKVWQKVL